MRDLSPKQENTRHNGVIPCLPNQHKFYKGFCDKCGYQDYVYDPRDDYDRR